MLCNFQVSTILFSPDSHEPWATPTRQRANVLQRQATDAADVYVPTTTSTATARDTNAVHVAKLPDAVTIPRAVTTAAIHSAPTNGPEPTNGPVPATTPATTDITIPRPHALHFIFRVINATSAAANTPKHIHITTALITAPTHFQFTRTPKMCAVPQNQGLWTSDGARSETGHFAKDQSGSTFQLQTA